MPTGDASPSAVVRPRARALRAHGAVAGHASWVITSQGLSSLANFGVTVMVARAVSPDAFGWFAAAFAMYAATLVFTRSAVAQPLAIRFAARPDAQREEIAAAAAAACVLGAAGGLLTAAFGGVVAVTGGDAGSLLVVAVSMPALMLQDLWRLGFFTAGRARSAAGNDLVWVLSQAALMWLIYVGTDATPGAAQLTACWTVAAGVAAWFGGRQMGLRPRWRQGVAFLRRLDSLAGALSLAAVIHLVGAYLVIVALVPVVGAAGVGALRGAHALMGPYVVITMGFVTAGPAEASRILARRPAGLLPAMTLASGGLAVVASTVGIAMLLLPTAVGESLLGESWPVAHTLILPVACAAVAQAVSLGGLVGLQVTEAKADLVRVTLASQSTSAILAVSAGMIGGLRAAAWGLVCGPCVAAALAWRRLPRILADRRWPAVRGGDQVASVPAAELAGP